MPVVLLHVTFHSVCSVYSVITSIFLYRAQCEYDAALYLLMMSFGMGELMTHFPLALQSVGEWRATPESRVAKLRKTFISHSLQRPESDVNLDFLIDSLRRQNLLLGLLLDHHHLFPLLPLILLPLSSSSSSPPPALHCYYQIHHDKQS